MSLNSNLQNKQNQNNIGILLISHGSTLPFAQDVFIEIAEKYRIISDYPVEIGYMKVSKPTISDAIHNLSLKSVNKIIAIPVFLADGIHTLVDIPLMLGLKNKETDPRASDGIYPKEHYLNTIDKTEFDGEITLLDSIGFNPLILQIITNKVNEVFKKSDDLNEDNTGIILISHGSRLNYNSEFINKLLINFKKKNNYKSTLGFMELSSPSIPVAINEFLKNNNFDNLIAVPVFIAPGIHTMRDIPKILKLPTKIESKENHSHSHNHNHSHSHSHEDVEIDFDGKIIYLDPIGSNSLLIEIINQVVEKEIQDI
jgi:sirohydrochlorin cobaltochelatase